jgi:hypothetical protein
MKREAFTQEKSDLYVEAEVVLKDEYYSPTLATILQPYKKTGKSLHEDTAALLCKHRTQS